MERYLENFHRGLLKNWRGSLVKVGLIRHRNAKEYFSRLSKTRKIERISWGWYFIPDKIEGVFDFLKKDKNFKILVAQSAASFWNGDFIHRNIYSLVVRDRSYGKALKEFGKRNGWNFNIEVNENIERETHFRKIRGLRVEEPAETAAECIQKWAFADAFSIILGNKKIRAELKRFYWKRVSGTNVRLGQVISYTFEKNRTSEMPDILKRQIEESLERVRELA